MDLKSAATIDAALLGRAARHLDDCHLCPHHCGLERARAAGYCRVAHDSYIASEMLHMGEEALMQPAHAIFLSGCTARCTFCTAAKFAFVSNYGVKIEPLALAERMVRRQDEGPRSIAFIGGDPVPHIPFILSALAALGPRKRVPIVFNSNFYLTRDALDLLTPAVDIFMPDLKFGPDEGVGGCSLRLSAMPLYWSTITGNIDSLDRCGERIIVRHLLMPGHIDCCTLPVLHWLSARPRLALSLLTQYLAPGHLRGELAAPLPQAEIERAARMARDLDLKLVE